MRAAASYLDSCNPSPAVCAWFTGLPVNSKFVLKTAGSAAACTIVSDRCPMAGYGFLQYFGDTSMESLNFGSMQTAAGFQRMDPCPVQRFIGIYIPKSGNFSLVQKNGFNGPLGIQLFRQQSPSEFRCLWFRP